MIRGHIVSPWQEDIADFGIGLSFQQPAHVVAWRAGNGKTTMCHDVDYIPQSVTKNLASHDEPDVSK